MKEDRLRIVGEELYFDGWKIADINEKVPATILGKFKKLIFSSENKHYICDNCEHGRGLR